MFSFKLIAIPPLAVNKVYRFFILYTLTQKEQIEKEFIFS